MGETLTWCWYHIGRKRYGEESGFFLSLGLGGWPAGRGASSQELLMMSERHPFKSSRKLP